MQLRNIEQLAERDEPRLYEHQYSPLGTDDPNPRYELWDNDHPSQAWHKPRLICTAYRYKPEVPRYGKVQVVTQIAPRVPVIPADGAC